MRLTRPALHSVAGAASSLSQSHSLPVSLSPPLPVSSSPTLFGYTHDWSIKKRGSLHLVNLPPVAYIFTAGKPNGWVLAEVAESGLTLMLHSIDPRHQQHGQRVELAW